MAKTKLWAWFLFIVALIIISTVGACLLVYFWILMYYTQRHWNLIPYRNSKIFELPMKGLKRFYQNPSLKTLDKIQEHEKIFEWGYGWPYWMFYISACVKVDKRFHCTSPGKMKKYHATLEKFKDPNHIFSKEDTMSLRMLYYATGKKRYLNIIKRVLLDSKQKYDSKLAKFYNSHIIKDKLNLEPISDKVDSDISIEIPVELFNSLKQK